MITALSIIGPASNWLRDRVVQFCKSVVGDPWGEIPDGRLVVAENMPATMQTYLPAVRFAAWAERERSRDAGAHGVGMGFVASDGVLTAVVAGFPEPETRNELVSIACHELLELTMPGDSDAKTMHALMRHVVWSEHVVERRRASVFERFGWERSVFDRSLLVESWETYLRDYPQWLQWAVANDAVPNELYGAWQFLARDVAVAYGHAQAGNRDEESDLERFVELQRPAVATAWLDLMGACDDVFDAPDLSIDEMDVTAGDGGWMRVHDALGEQWKQDFTALASR